MLNKKARQELTPGLNLPKLGFLLTGGGFTPPCYTKIDETDSKWTNTIRFLTSSTI